MRTKCGSKALKTFGASVAGDAAAIIHHSLHEHAEHAAQGAHEATEKIFESAIEAGFEFKFKGTNGQWKLEAVELINEVELGANMHVAKAKFTGVVKRSLYHAHEEEGGEHAEAEFKGQVTFTGQCPKCGTYTLTPDLVKELPSLDATKRARIGKFLATSWNLLGQPQELDLNFVKEQLES